MTRTFKSVQKWLRFVIYHIAISDLVWSLTRMMFIEYILKNMRNINVALKALAVSMCVYVWLNLVRWLNLPLAIDCKAPLLILGNEDVFHYL